MSSRMHALRFEEAGGQRLPLGGKHGYLGVRGGQGRKKDKYQGTTPRKRHRTGHHDTPLEAAIEFAQMKEDLDLGIHSERSAKKAQPRTSDQLAHDLQGGFVRQTALHDRY